MGLKFTLRIILSILSFKHIVGRGNTFIFYSKSGYSIVGISSLKAYVSESKIECAVQCAIEEGCRTASFNNSAHKCYLHATDVCPKIEVSETSSVLYIGKTDGQCIDPWKAFKINCYYFGQNKLTMTEAQVDHLQTMSGALNDCQTMNGNLAKIENAYENDWINLIVPSFGIPIDYCIGLQKVNGKWRWLSDNSTPGFKNWRPGQPSGGGSCVRLTNSDQFTWNDDSCGLKTRYICKKC